MDAGLTELCLSSVSTADPFGLIEKNPVCFINAVCYSSCGCCRDKLSLNLTLQVRTALMMCSTLHTELFVMRQNEFGLKSETKIQNLRFSSQIWNQTTDVNTLIQTSNE